MEHTNEFLAAAFGAYYGCEVEVSHADDPDTVYTKLAQEITLSELEDGETAHQLILTPLSEITDEHAIEVAAIMGFLNSMSGWGKWYCQNGFPHNCALSADKQNRITDYLRSKSYDCGFRHLPSLIEAGIAIKKQS